MTRLPAQTLHAHTCFVDGADTPLAMAQAAAAAGLASFGLSEHGFVPPEAALSPGEEPCWLTEADTPRYLAAARAAQAAVAGRLAVYVGLELDSYGFDACAVREQLDYCIGSVHLLPGEGGLFSVDASRETLLAAIRRCYGGDPLRLAARYYAEVAAFATRCRPDILGHIDLITKFDEDGTLFSEAGRAYRRLALAAVDAAVEAGCLIEINTGAIARGYRQTPYPRRFLLERVRARGGRIVLSSDAHSAAARRLRPGRCRGAGPERGLYRIPAPHAGGLRPRAALIVPPSLSRPAPDQYALITEEVQDFSPPAPNLPSVFPLAPHRPAVLTIPFAPRRPVLIRCPVPHSADPFAPRRSPRRFSKRPRSQKAGRRDASRRPVHAVFPEHVRRPGGASRAVQAAPAAAYPMDTTR